MEWDTTANHPLLWPQTGQREREREKAQPVSLGAHTHTHSRCMATLVVAKDGGRHLGCSTQPPKSELYRYTEMYSIPKRLHFLPVFHLFIYLLTIFFWNPRIPRFSQDFSDKFVPIHLGASGIRGLSEQKWKLSFINTHLVVG